MKKAISKKLTTVIYYLFAFGALFFATGKMKFKRYSR